MLNAVAGEDLPLLGVEPDRHADDQGPLGRPKPLRDSLAHVRVGQRLLELGERHAEERRVPLERVGLDRKVVDPRHAASLREDSGRPARKRGA